MNTYFKQSLVQVQSEEFISDFKVSIRLIIKVIKIVILLLTGVFVLAKSFYLKLSKQDVVPKVTICNNLDNLLTLVEGDCTISEDIVSVDDTLDNSLIEVAINSLEVIEEITNTEAAVVEFANEEAAIVEITTKPIVVESTNDKSAVQVSRQSQLKSMKAAELRELCVGYGISYKNKSQAVVAILEKENSMLDELSDNESATVQLSNEELSDNESISIQPVMV